MQGSSRAAAAAVHEAFGVVLDTPDDRRQLARDLFAVTDTVDGNVALRRALADPSREGDAKSRLVAQLFGGKISDGALRLTQAAVSQRWSEDKDLTDTLESLAVGSVVAAAERENYADQLEDEVFRFERIVAGNSGLRDAITDRRASAESKRELVARLLHGKSCDGAQLLLERAVTTPRGRRFDQVIDAYLREAGTRRDQLAAVVTTAVELDASQRERLVGALSRHYGKPVHLYVVLDQAVLGGIRIQIGDDVVDGTILRRLDEARRHFGG